MNQNQFFDEFYKSLELIAAENGVRLERAEIAKNNGMQKGISFRFAENPSLVPTIYPSHFLEDAERGIPIKSIAADVFMEVKESFVQTQGKYSHFLDPAYAKERLTCAVVGWENNREMLKDIPYERVADLALYARWDLKDGMSAVIKNEALSILKMTKEEVFSLAKQNTAGQADFMKLDDMLEGMLYGNGLEGEAVHNRDSFFAESPLYVLTTKDQVQGAALIADTETLKNVHEALGEDFYILPSSIHELLVIRKSECPGSAEELKELVASINQDSVRPVDRLTDSVYQFDGHKLSIAGEAGIERDNGIAAVFTHKHSR